MELILALDAGTTSVRSVAFDRDLNVVDESYRDLTQFYPSPGEVEHDALEIVELAIATLEDVTTRVRGAGHIVVALGITNQRETTVGFDRDDGAPLSRAIVWQDRRTSEMCQRLDDEGHGPAVRETTGLVLDPYFSATKMRWMIERGLADGARRAVARHDRHLAAVGLDRRRRWWAVPHRRLQRLAHVIARPEVPHVVT